MDNSNSFDLQMRLNRVTIVLTTWNPSNNGEGGDDDGDERTKTKNISEGSSDLLLFCSRWCGGGQGSLLPWVPSRKCLV
jgi:hypothetical protein